MTIDPALQAHKDWINFVQPVGLVVSPRALIEAQAHIDVRAAMAPQQVLLGITNDDHDRLSDFAGFTTELLGWRESDLQSGEALSDLCVTLTDLGDTLAPTFAVRGPDSDEWLLLVVETSTGDDLDDDQANPLRGWSASHQARFERLLRERDVPIGILTNRECIRLVYAPRGESTGHVTFVVRHMTEVQGRPILSALLMLLDAQRLFALGEKQRLPAILRQSRRYQNEVSERLAEQVLESLWVLLYGFQAADEFSRGELLHRVLNQSPNDIYGGLLATIMRLVFTLYAEDRALLPTETTLYSENYSLLGLFERLREDNAHYPDTMTQRYGAWAQLLTLFRLLHDGASHDPFRVPPRHGRLFDPDVYPFLEGRTGARDDDRTEHEGHDHQTIPRISDFVVYTILSNLLYLAGDRLSYAALDVEEIGSVYEAMMGFRLEITTGPSIGVKPKTKKGVRADVIVDLQRLLAAKPEQRAKLLKEEAATDMTGRALDALKSAATHEQIVTALGNKASPYTPRILAKGAMALQPSEERRRSGSHYTPRSLTQPIVKTTLQPILDQLCGDPDCAAFGARNDPKRLDPVPGCITQEGEARTHRHPRPEQILDLKVCDPAMGSGAFLVEACRYLGDALVRAWQVHGGVPPIPPDEDIVLYARRRIAQKCLYGVDRNPFAVDLAKLSLWLATLAKDHPFTFLDHALRHGDSLVGLSRDQIVHFDWEGAEQSEIVLSDALRTALEEAEDKRARIHELADSDDVDEKQRLLGEAERATRLVRTAGDLLIAAFFAAEKDRDRKALRASTLEALRGALRSGLAVDDAAVRLLRVGDKPLPPFHWFLEFPEVFSRANAGFDAFVGNPPFAGKNTLIKSNHDAYPAWLKVLHEETHGNADLVAQFFRRAFTLIRQAGAFGLIATNTIGQGDTRGTGLRWICKHGGTIYEARKRVKWPGSAAVIVSVLHVRKGRALTNARLDGRDVERITAFLFHTGSHNDPLPLRENGGKSFIGSILLGMGFTFDDDNEGATPIAEMHRLIAKNPSNAERIFPYIGGEEVNDSPTQVHRRYVINFGEMTEEEARVGWPDLMEIVERKVKPARLIQNREIRARYWWRFGETTPALVEAIRGLDRVLVTSRHQPQWGITFAGERIVFSEALVIFALRQAPAFAIIQSRLHEAWARFFGSSMKDDLRYTPSDCFETFPFPLQWQSNTRIETIGQAYLETRAHVMAASHEGLTKTYNRFHDPDERRPEILNLRELHNAMDRAVLDAYGWTDIQPRCEFILDYEDEEGDETTSRRKKPWRYRWPDDIRDEVLARLLALNAGRAKQEQLAAAPEERRTSQKKRAAPTSPVPLFDRTPRTVPTIVPTYSMLPDGAWIRPKTNDVDEELAALAAVMKASGGPTPIQTIRLAQCLVVEPSLLTPILDNKQSQIWNRLVGGEARVTAQQNQIAVSTAWGKAVTQLRGTGRLKEDLASQTWAPGPDLDALYTEGWPDGRAAFVLDFLSQQDIADLITTLPVPIQERVLGIAA
jgi:hypothetical protein